MIARLALLVAVPGWLLAALAATTGLATLVAMLVMVFGGISTATSADLHYQCDSAIGPDPAVTETVAATTSQVPETFAPEEVPSTNPYAEMTLGPQDSDASDWQRHCVSALRSAPYQLPAVAVVNGGSASGCASRIALGLVGETVAAATGSSSDSAAFTALVISRASAVTSTGVCESAASAVPRSSASAASGDQAAAGCPDAGNTGRISLPDTIAAQAICGQRVASAAISAGDLVFWDYRSYAPTRAGIALSTTELVAVDPGSDRVVRQPLPTGTDVRVKRVLAGAS